MKFNKAYFEACTRRQVPTSVLVANALALEGKTEQEQDEMREVMAKEIVEKYPLKERASATNTPSATRNT